MKRIILSIFVIVLFSPVYSQEIEEIIIRSEMVDEPPTKEGQTKYLIKFKKDRHNNYLAKHYYENGKKKRLSKTSLIEQQRIKKLEIWQNKNEFTLSELGLEYHDLKTKEKDNLYKLNYDIPDPVIIKIDSFNFCQDNKLGRQMTSGGLYIDVNLNYTSGNTETYRFFSQDAILIKFNFRDYIYISEILKDKIPDNIPGNYFFSTEKLKEFIFLYLQTVECEDYYYQQYIDDHPEMSPKERRMKINWDFKSYLEIKRNSENK